MLSNIRPTTLTPATEQSFFAVLKRCVIVSVGLLAVATVFHLEPWQTMAAGGAPLVWYHLAYLARRARIGLSQTAIDSVYYFGFLITIAALALSAVTLAGNDGAVPLNHIAYQFGLGLFATGYAVLARMHLTSISALVDDASPEAVLDSYVHRSRELVTNVELASTQFVELSNSLMLKSQEVAETARLSTEKAMLEVARAFDQELRSTMASAREGLAEIRGLVAETSFTHERDQLARSIRETIKCVSELNEVLGEFAEYSQQGTSATKEAAAASVSLNATIETFRTNLEGLGGEDGQMTAAATAMARAQATVVSGAESIGHAVEHLGEVAATTSGIGVTFKNIKSLTLKANEQLEALVHTTGRLEEATGHIERSAAATERLATSVEKAAVVMPMLSERGTTLNTSLGRLSDAIVTFEREVSALPEPAITAVELSRQLSGALADIQKALEESSAHGGRIAAQANAQAVALEKAAGLAQHATAIEKAGEAIGAVLANLTESVERMQSTLGASTGALNTAISSATQSLETDVRRSSDAARMFGERLTNVAQIIIDHTQAKPS